MLAIPGFRGEGGEGKVCSKVGGGRVESRSMGGQGVGSRSQIQQSSQIQKLWWIQTSVPKQPVVAPDCLDLGHLQRKPSSK